MAEPFCTIEWHGDGRQQIRLFDGAELGGKTARAVCQAIADEAGAVTTVLALQKVVTAVAERHGLRAEWLQGGTRIQSTWSQPSPCRGCRHEPTCRAATSDLGRSHLMARINA